MEEVQPQKKLTFSHLPRRQAVNINFQDLTYTVPQDRKGSKLLLRSISGNFKSGQLHAILGPSGSGKSTLLNILAGYKWHGTTGTILINGEPRNLKTFRKISRYIMQQDLIQPMLTVDECMMIAANLKLGNYLNKCDKLIIISEILELLRLNGTRSTITNSLSGGEQKRLSVALELINNPPVLFLDEPTTGLDDLSCTQCITLLKQLALGGRTVVCSIHTPSAKLFSIFDNVYVISSGQCVYQGYGPDVIPFLSNIGIICPTTYNPADFIIEVCCGEYGNYQDRMVQAIENGRNFNYRNKLLPLNDLDNNNGIHKFIELIPSNNFEEKSSTWLQQFWILLVRMWLQMWRDKNYLLLKIIVHILLGLLMGNLYIGIGFDGSKTIFNFGFYFTCIIFFMYVPMMPVLLSFPTEIQHIKREYFNKWYSLSSYFCALTISTLPVQTFLGTLYLTFVYFFSSQPIEWERIIPFYSVLILTSIVSESFGLLVSSVLNVVNGTFVGPVMTVPLMLLATYGFGEGYASIPLLIKIAMQFSYLRYSLTAIVQIMLRGRERLVCPETEEICMFTDLEKFIEVMGMDRAILWLDVIVLFGFLLIVRGASYYLLRQRLSPNKTFVTLQYVGRFVKSQFSIDR